jgi:hypothetical protein
MKLRGARPSIAGGARRRLGIISGTTLRNIAEDIPQLVRAWVGKLLVFSKRNLEEELLRTHIIAVYVLPYRMRNCRQVKGGFMRLISLAILLAVCCLVPATGFATTVGGPGAPCGASSEFPTESFTVFEGNAETTINGDLVEAPLTTSLGATAALGVCTSGYVAIFENANGSLTDPSTWSDLVYFDGAGNVTMYSDPPTNGVANWPVSVADKGVFENSLGQGIYSAQTSGTELVCNEDPLDPAKLICTHVTVTTTYDYTFVSDSPVSGEDELPAAPGPVPEPMTLSLLGTGMLGVVGVVRRKWLG